MKRFLLVVSIVSYCFTGMAQDKMSPEEARVFCAQYMASFTNAVSGFYEKGMGYDQFQVALCGKNSVTQEGIAQLKVAHGFLAQGVSNDYIIKSYPGKEVAASLNYLQVLHKNGFESDGSELFGGRTGTDNSNLAKNADGPCKWYQVWCLIQQAAQWVEVHWVTIAQVIYVILNGWPAN